jgi:hypothetical protein
MSEFTTNKNTRKVDHPQRSLLSRKCKQAYKEMADPLKSAPLANSARIHSAVAVLCILLHLQVHFLIED